VVCIRLSALIPNACDLGSQVPFRMWLCSQRRSHVSWRCWFGLSGFYQIMTRDVPSGRVGLAEFVLTKSCLTRIDCGSSNISDRRSGYHVSGSITCWGVLSGESGSLCSFFVTTVDFMLDIVPISKVTIRESPSSMKFPILSFLLSRNLVPSLSSWVIGLGACLFACGWTSLPSDE